MDVSNAKWVKSTKSGAAGHCLEVAKVGDSYAVRNSNKPEAGFLEFTQAEWTAFVAGVADGEFRF
jgi:hypothetical protein